MSRAAISVERVEWNPEENTVTVYEKQNKTSSSKKAPYEVSELMALLAGQIPSPYETITYYDGISSSSYRGQEKKEKRRDEKMVMKRSKGGLRPTAIKLRN